MLLWARNKRNTSMIDGRRAYDRGWYMDRLDELAATITKLGIDQQVDFERLHVYNIITHSTAIEGSTLTYEENLVMFENGIVPASKGLTEQLMNLDLKQAYEVMQQLARARTPITVPLLKALSALVMKNTGSAYSTMAGDCDEAKGDLRLQNVSAGVGGRSYPDWRKVPDLLENFCNWMAERLQSIDSLTPAETYRLSFETHWQLVSIHPWSDGNGRMSRLLMNMVQMEGGLVPTYIRNEHRSAYITALSTSQVAKDPEAFLSFMEGEAADILQEQVDGYLSSIGGNTPS